MNLMEKMLSMKPFTCPNCAQALPLEDVNMAQDMALCRACGYAGAFLSASAIPRMTDEEMAANQHLIRTMSVKPPMSLSSVVFPHPLGPTKVTNSPRFTSSDTPLRTSLFP